MPKMLPGVLIKTDKSVRIYIKNLNSGGKNFILKDLDENNLFVKESEVAYIQEEVYKMQDRNSYVYNMDQQK
jgi:hypothetical protein